MGMIKMTPALGLTLLLAACGGEKPAPVEEAPATLAAGLYEVSSEVTDLVSTDNTTPATRLKQGDKRVTRACVAADGKPEPELLAEAEGDKCKIDSSYVRNGRMSAQASCTREGQSGGVTPSMAGSFTKDGFKGEIISATYFARDGDYRMTREVIGKRIGDCPADGAEKAPA